MEQTLAPNPRNDIAGVDEVLTKLKQGPETTVKISSSLAVQSLLLAELLDKNDFPQSPLFILLADELEKFNFYKTINFWRQQYNLKAKINISSKIGPNELLALQGGNKIFLLMS